jgi:hypothetical protein
MPPATMRTGVLANVSAVQDVSVDAVKCAPVSQEDTRSAFSCSVKPAVNCIDVTVLQDKSQMHDCEIKPHNFTNA